MTLRYFPLALQYLSYPAIEQKDPKSVIETGARGLISSLNRLIVVASIQLSSADLYCSFVKTKDGKDEVREAAVSVHDDAAVAAFLF